MRQIVLILLASSFCGGCHLYKTIEVSVVDIETRKPISDATVRTSYAMFFDLFPPAAGEFPVDATGTARVRIAHGWEDRVGLRLSAGGYSQSFYLTEEGSLISPGVFLLGIPPRLRMTREKPWPKSMMIEAWREPVPQFEVVVADDFRGHLRLYPTPFELIELAPGQRIVPLRPNQHGVVTLPLTRPILASMGDVDVRFESGAAVPRAVRRATDRASVPIADSTIAVRYGIGGVFIGTRAEAEAAGYPQPKR